MVKVSTGRTLEMGPLATSRDAQTESASSSVADMIQRWVDIVIEGGGAPYAVTQMLRYCGAAATEFAASSAKLKNSHLPDALIPDVLDGIVHAPAGPV